MTTYYLARESATGFPELLDGGHDSPEGVAKAAKLFGRIFNDHGPFVMASIDPLPDVDPPINEESAAICARLIQGDNAR